MSTESDYYVVSKNGFGGPKFRVAERFIESGDNCPNPPPEYSIAAGIYVTVVTQESSSGKLIKLSGRDPTRKVQAKVALLSVSNKDNLASFLNSRNPLSGKISEYQLPTTELEPLQFLLSTIAKAADNSTAPRVDTIDTNKLKEADASAKKFQEFVMQNSVAPPERPGRIKQLIRDQALKGEKAFILNWICPPGSPLQLDSTSGKLYRQFNRLDFDMCFQNDYRLYPRLWLERDLCQAIAETGSGFEYVKAVADDNPFCLYSPSVKIDGVATTMSNISAYTQYASTELDVIAKHTQLPDELKPFLRPLAEDVIRQYAVEGYILYEAFKDNVVLAWNESTRRSAIIDSLRKAKGIPPLPKIYVLHEKKEGSIINDF